MSENSPAVTTTPAAAFVSSLIDVRLENFEGPLDLLLYLIKKNDLDIYDIPIAQITQEYLAYLDLMKDLNLETAGEFLVMASTLMQIKAQLLLPSPEAVEGEDGPDPRVELVNKLLEYQKFKEAASILTTWNEKAKDIYYRAVAPQFEDDDFMLKSSVLDLMAAFKRVLDNAPREVGQVLIEEIPIEVRIREILDRLEVQASLEFHELFTGKERRIDLIVTFLALLELVRMKQAVARQSANFDSIRIYRADSVPAEDVPAMEEPAPSPLPPAVEPAPEPESETVAVADPVLEEPTDGTH